ncbi:uncharacterized protein TRAVEDRAFT_43173 [Trametes versicolor FP-101664 SS1]|uniref:uncharacterized protein n=1 Tax=Trametes versicolor (strain FP-101664) TaxID=717944 RepID=UPI00046216DF|nr:uncharacterized protein TRAVEDRAFT_43173 [Trametes versicolor FP-101664 SS1]EIW62851.1 hypothetical protein TRAVEDRAFT_43173 [Trametes versicolor FP-101664 SS1]
MSATEVNTLVPVRDDVKVLCAKIQSQDSTLKLQGVLNERLPNLEQLHLERVPADGDDAVHAPRSEPPYTLRAANLPKLQILAAVDTIVSLEMPLCRNLRMLHLEFDDQKKVDRVPLACFLDIMRNCTSLQSLYEYCYVDARTPRGTPPPPVLSLMGHTRLKVLQILEDSDTLSRILSSLIIPASVNLTAAAVVGEKGVLRDIFPRDRTQLQILQRATKVEARHTLRDCCLAAHMPGKDSGCLTLELSTTPEGMRRRERDLLDGTFMHTMIQSLDVFQDCPARTLCLGGNLAQVRPESWIAAFDRFPDIEELQIEDIQDQPGKTLLTLFDALAVSSNVHRGVVLPRLQTIKLEGAINQLGLLDAVRSCFTRRAQLGARPLHRMELIPSRDSHRGWTADEVARFQRERHTLAKIVELKI